MVKEAIKRTIQKCKWKRNKKYISYFKDEHFTLVSNTCTGGFIYHDLKHIFDSPTINLWIKEIEFPIFVDNLETYIAHGKIIEIKDDKYSYPCGAICVDESFNLPQIKLFFKHYDSFEQARKKWDERKKRIKFNKIAVVLMSLNPSEDLLSWFKALGRKKVMFTGRKQVANSSGNIFYCKCLKKHNHPNMFVNLFGKRGYEVFNLNNFIKEL